LAGCIKLLLKSGKDFSPYPRLGAGKHDEHADGHRIACLYGVE
jgi:hypothetical protein